MKLTTKEELFLELYRSLDPAQQSDWMSIFLRVMRAQRDANALTSKANLGNQLRVTGNARVEETYGLPKKRKIFVKPIKRLASKRSPRKDNPDDLAPGMDDALG